MKLHSTFPIYTGHGDVWDRAIGVWRTIRLAYVLVFTGDKCRREGNQLYIYEEEIK